jgi:hypothetical protein
LFQFEEITDLTGIDRSGLSQSQKRKKERKKEKRNKVYYIVLLNWINTTEAVNCVDEQSTTTRWSVMGDEPL